MGNKAQFDRKESIATDKQKGGENMNGERLYRALFLIAVGFAAVYLGNTVIGEGKAILASQARNLLR